MQILRTLPAAAVPGSKPVALTLGNFDGVHLGHQAMLRRVVEAASDLDLIPAAMTFEPTPREFFAQAANSATGGAPARLMPLRARLERLAAAGIARVYLMRFDRLLADVEAAIFVDDILAQRLNVRWLLAGDDACFGRHRQGNLAFLQARENPFMIEAMATLAIEGERVSSTAVRSALQASDFKHAARLLGRPYTIAGQVAYGDALGRTIGFPTLNQPLRFRPPLSGVFAVRVHGLGGQSRVYDGVASLGVRPTVKAAGAPPVLETHVFDFDSDAYGQRVEIEFVQKLRDEQRFANVAALTQQIERDAQQARDILTSVRKQSDKQSITNSLNV